jgi:hypothetical protein
VELASELTALDGYQNRETYHGGLKSYYQRHW